MLQISIMNVHSKPEVESLLFNLIASQKDPQDPVEVIIAKGKHQYCHSLTVHRTVIMMDNFVKKMTGKEWSLNVKVLLE